MMKFILDIVSTPAILVALIAILGLVLQKKKLPDIIKGGIKTFVGFLVVSGGAGIVQNSLNPFGTMFEHAFHLSGVVPNNEAIGSSSFNHIWLSYCNDYVCRYGIQYLNWLVLLDSNISF